MFLLLKRKLSHLAHFRVSSWIAVIATELIIVFVGVYLADLFAERREERFLRERQALILEALDRDIAPFIAQGSVLLESIRARYTSWEQEKSNGAQPVPFYLPATASLPRPHGILWSSMLDSGGLDLLPVGLIADISEFYARSERMIDRYRRLDDFVQRQVLPNLESEPETFYADQITLRPIFSNYADELAAAMQYAEQTVSLGEEISVELAAGVH